MSVSLLGILVEWRRDKGVPHWEGSLRLHMWVSSNLDTSLHVWVCLCSTPLTPIQIPTAGHEAELKGGCKVERRRTCQCVQLQHTKLNRSLTFRCAKGCVWCWEKKLHDPHKFLFNTLALMSSRATYRPPLWTVCKSSAHFQINSEATRLIFFFIFWGVFPLHVGVAYCNQCWLKLKTKDIPASCSRASCVALWAIFPRLLHNLHHMLHPSACRLSYFFLIVCRGSLAYICWQHLKRRPVFVLTAG